MNNSNLRDKALASSKCTASECGSASSRKTIQSGKAVEAMVELAEKCAELAALEIDRQYSAENNEQSKGELISAKKNVAAAEARLATYTYFATG